MDLRRLESVSDLTPEIMRVVREKASDPKARLNDVLLAVERTALEDGSHASFGAELMNPAIRKVRKTMAEERQPVTRCSHVYVVDGQEMQCQTPATRTREFAYPFVPGEIGTLYYRVCGRHKGTQITERETSDEEVAV